MRHTPKYPVTRNAEGHWRVETPAGDLIALYLSESLARTAVAGLVKRDRARAAARRYQARKALKNRKRALKATLRAKMAAHLLRNHNSQT